MNTKYVACDVQYAGDAGYAAGVGFDNLADTTPSHIAHAVVRPVADYKPGAFYLRELPCLLALLRAAESMPAVIFVDGYVWLAGQQPALGARLHDALNKAVAVIGVAKSSLRIAGESHPLSRFGLRPIYISAVGLELDTAVEMVSAMHGVGRLPTMLQRADAEARARAGG
jgi:deoxyribonuclease V